MYTIEIINGDSTPFFIVTNDDGLFPILSILDNNTITFFKVYFAGIRCEPETLGWGHYRGWVQKFEHEPEIGDGNT